MKFQYFSCAFLILCEWMINNKIFHISSFILYGVGLGLKIRQKLTYILKTSTGRPYDAMLFIVMFLRNLQ